MEFNKEQREGVARSLDTLGTSAVVGAVVGVTGHSAITGFEICSLSVLAVILYGIAFFVRGIK
jgi:uncharacterized membrane protein YoaK (UPF0700 family)